MLQLEVNICMRQLEANIWLNCPKANCHFRIVRALLVFIYQANNLKRITLDFHLLWISLLHATFSLYSDSFLTIAMYLALHLFLKNLWLPPQRIFFPVFAQGLLIIYFRVFFFLLKVLICETSNSLLQKLSSWFLWFCGRTSEWECGLI